MTNRELSRANLACDIRVELNLAAVLRVEFGQVSLFASLVNNQSGAASLRCHLSYKGSIQRLLSDVICDRLGAPEILNWLITQID